MNYDKEYMMKGKLEEHEIRSIVDRVSVIYGDSFSHSIIDDNNLMLTSLNGNTLFFDTTGTLLGTYKYASSKRDYRGNFGYYLVENGGLYGATLSNGVLTIPCIYRDTFTLSSGRAVVSPVGTCLYGLIDYKNESLIDPMYAKLVLLGHNQYKAHIRNWGWGIIDKDNNVLLDFGYQVIQSTLGSLVKIKGDDSSGVYSLLSKNKLISKITTVKHLWGDYFYIVDMANKTPQGYIIDQNTLDIMKSITLNHTITVGAGAWNKKCIVCNKTERYSHFGVLDEEFNQLYPFKYGKERAIDLATEYCFNKAEYSIPDKNYEEGT